MTDYVFPPRAPVAVEIAGDRARFPVNRIYCVGRNYAEHIREMGRDLREPPFFFMKPADAIVANGAEVPYPMRTSNFHHEIELVVAIGTGGSRISPERSLENVFGYAVGNDYTRRDLQLEMRDKGRPWETGKSCSAAISAIHRVAEVGHLERAAIWLDVNGTRRQQSNVSELIWNVAEVIAELSTLFELVPGDLVYTGTPAGVGAVRVGDVVTGGIDGLDRLENRIGPSRGPAS
jgi:fumarylpyruvate hydrolase